MRHFLLSETNWKTVKEKKPELAVLPWGACEAHNYHLPYGTDCIETELICAEAASRATAKRSRVIVLPLIPFGVNTGQLDICLTINMNPSTQFAILKDVAASLAASGLKKLLIVNGHGGNDFRQMLRELGTMFPGLFMATCNWFQSADQSLFFEKGGGHADEMETSLLLHLTPGLVLPLSQAGKGKARRFSIKALNEGWAWSERKWTRVTDDTGVGDPSAATAEKGAAYFEAVVDKLTELMISVASTSSEEMYVHDRIT
jgi:creatinine amidohydrolase